MKLFCPFLTPQMALSHFSRLAAAINENRHLQASNPILKS